MLFIASDAVHVASQTCHVDGDSCSEFNQWMQLKRSGLQVDFRRIQKVGSGLRYLRDYVVNLSTFEERSITSG
jgi:hypothetical protein